MKKIFLVMLAVFIYGSLSYAGQLGQNENGFYYVKDNGQLAISEWVNFDIDGDGMQEYYHLNAAGFLDVNTTTSDGYQVNERGQWVENGVVKKTIDIHMLSHIAETLFLNKMTDNPSSYTVTRYGYWEKASEIEFNIQNIYGTTVRRYLLIDKADKEEDYFNYAEDGANIFIDNSIVGRAVVVSDKSMYRPNDYNFTYVDPAVYKSLTYANLNVGFKMKSQYNLTKKIDQMDYYRRNIRKKYISDWD